MSEQKTTELDADKAGSDSGDLLCADRINIYLSQLSPHIKERQAAKTCKGKNCTAKRRGEGHSSECIEEHNETTSHEDVEEIFPGTMVSLNKLKI